MAISLTTEGLRLDYRTSIQTSSSGTYPIGTIIGVYISDGSGSSPNSNITLPGTWLSIRGTGMGPTKPSIGAKVYNYSMAVRVN